MFLGQVQPEFAVSVQGLEVSVTVTTVGFACMRLFRTLACVNGQNIDVRPYVMMPDVPCQTISGTVTHSANVKVPKAGEYVVVVHGSDELYQHEIVITRGVTVGG